MATRIVSAPKVWQNNNRVAVDNSGKVILCETCPCFCVCEDTDILFLVDTTGSMTAAIAAVAEAISIIIDRLGPGSTCRFGLADFKDIGDVYIWHMDVPLTSDFTSVQVAAASLIASGGGDIPEAHLIALEDIADEWETTVGGSSDLSRDRIVLIFSDAPPHVGGLYPTEEDTLATLLDSCIHLFAFDYGTCSFTVPNSCMDITPVIRDLCDGTGGEFFRDAGLLDVAQLANDLCLIFGRGFSCPYYADDKVRVPCCPNRISKNLFTVLTIDTGSAPDLDGLIIPLVFDGGYSWTGTVTSGIYTVQMTISCVGTEWIQSFHIRGGGCVVNVFTTGIDLCDPFSATLTFVSGPFCPDTFTGTATTQE